ncbi:MAG: DUF4250 domain-containing protein [Bacillota bacterium]
MDIDMDVNILLSVVNTKLRNHYDSLEDLCKTEDIDENDVTKKLQKAGYKYDSTRNQFIIIDN